MLFLSPLTQRKGSWSMSFQRCILWRQTLLKMEHLSPTLFSQVLHCNKGWCWHSHPNVLCLLYQGSLPTWTCASLLQYARHVCGLHGAVVSVVAFKAKGRGFKSTHGCSHTVQKPSISPRLFSQCTYIYTYHLPFTINYVWHQCSHSFSAVHWLSYDRMRVSFEAC